MSEIDHIEQELFALRQQFSQSAALLGELSQIDQKFRQFSQDQQSLRATINEIKSLVENPQVEHGGLEQRLTQLETQVETRYEQLQAQLTNFRCDFDAMTRQVREELEQRQNLLHQFEQADLDALAKLTDGNRLQWIENSVQHLNSTVFADRSVLQSLERKHKTLNQTLNITTLIGFIGFVVLFMMILIFR